MSPDLRLISSTRGPIKLAPLCNLLPVHRQSERHFLPAPTFYLRFRFCQHEYVSSTPPPTSPDIRSRFGAITVPVGSSYLGGFNALE